MAMMMPHTIRGMKGRRISRQPITSRAAKPICIDISRASFTSIFRVVILHLQRRTEAQQKLIVPSMLHQSPPVTSHCSRLVSDQFLVHLGNASRRPHATQVVHQQEKPGERRKVPLFPGCYCAASCQRGYVCWCDSPDRKATN